MSDEWFYFDGRKTVGPLSIDKLLGDLAKYDPYEDVPVWRKQFDAWRNAGNVDELMAAFHAKANSVPPPVPISPSSNAMPKRKASKLRIIIRSTLILIAGLIGLALGQVVYEVCKPIAREIQRQARLDKVLDEVVFNLGSTLPKQIDEVTSLVDFRREGNTLVYSYRLSGSVVDLNALKSKTKDALLRKECKDANIVRLLTSSVATRHEYSDAASSKIVVSIDEHECNDFNRANECSEEDGKRKLRCHLLNK